MAGFSGTVRVSTPTRVRLKAIEREYRMRSTDNAIELILDAWGVLTPEQKVGILTRTKVRLNPREPIAASGSALSLSPPPPSAPETPAAGISEPFHAEPVEAPVKRGPGRPRKTAPWVPPAN